MHPCAAVCVPINKKDKISVCSFNSKYSVAICVFHAEAVVTVTEENSVHK